MNVKVKNVIQMNNQQINQNYIWTIVPYKKITIKV
jgi:hypothetical protein